MELKIFRDTLPQGGAGCTVKAELPLETEIRISDDLPPVGKLVKCFVRPVVLQRQLQPGRLTLEGYLRCTVFYQSEAEKGLCQTEQKLPFTRQLELPELAFTAWTAVVEGQTEYLNTRAADPRRIEVRGAYGLVVTVHTQCKTEVITALADGGIEQQLHTLQGVRSVAVLDKLVTLEGELVFAKPPAAVLDITGNACVAEVKLLAGKAVVKGELRVQCAWRAEGDTALQSQAAALPFQQVIDLEGITEDCHCLCVAEPVGFTLSQAESAAAQLTANVMLHLRAWRNYQLQVAVDAFSTRFETELTPQPLVTEQLLCTLNDTATATGSGPLPDAGAQLRACFVHYGPQQAVKKGEGWALAAKAVVTALAENTLGELESYEKTLEIAIPLPITPPEGTVPDPAENKAHAADGGPAGPLRPDPDLLRPGTITPLLLPPRTKKTRQKNGGFTDFSMSVNPPFFEQSAFTESLFRRIRRTVILRLCRKQFPVIFHHGLHVIFIHKRRHSVLIYRVIEA